jgi:hypothetical protein
MQGAANRLPGSMRHPQVHAHQKGRLLGKNCLAGGYSQGED